MPRRIHLALAAALALGVTAGGPAVPWTSAFSASHTGAGTGTEDATRPTTAPKPQEKGQARSRPRVSAIAVIRDADGRVLGTLRIERADAKKARVSVDAHGLTPGFHGFHIHSAGVCDAKAVDAATGSPFSSAGGHFQPGEHGDAAGNLPSLLAAADGTASATFTTDRFTVDRLGDADGSAIIVHAKPDNFANIPTRYTHPSDSTGTTGPDATTLATGDAGRRVGCGVIRVLG